MKIDEAEAKALAEVAIQEEVAKRTLEAEKRAEELRIRAEEEQRRLKEQV